MDRYDAHIETRNDLKNNILDCTHWCAAAFDVFDDTLIGALAQVYLLSYPVTLCDASCALANLSLFSSSPRLQRYGMSRLRTV